LWGRNKGRNFLSNSLLVTLYKDITHSGNQKLVKKTDHLLGISSKSIGKKMPNVSERFLGQWRLKQICLGNSHTRKYQVRNMKFPKLVRDVNLWMGSSDFSMEGKRTVSKKIF
jgi:hypothetical protein